MRGVRVVVAVLAIGLAASVPVTAAPARSKAAAKATKLSMQRLDSRNLHIANQGGAINNHGTLAVTVELRADHTVAVRSTGTRRDHNLYAGPSSRSTDDTSTWTTAWNGTWSGTAATLQLALVLDAHTCTRAKTTKAFDAAAGNWVTYQPEVLACRVAAANTTLTCAALHVELEAATTRAAAPPRIASWRCTASDTADLAETPPTLVFGKRTCVETLGGVRSGESYRRCAP